MLIGRLGYRLVFSDVANLELGLTVRTPLENPFREYTGVPLSEALSTDTTADFGGEVLRRLVSFYLRGAF